MYKKFFNLERAPFNINPDPSFYVPTAQHNEAICSLYYGITRRKGFVLLTGEVGTGKTLMLRYLMACLAKEKVAFAYLFNTLLSPLEFLQSAAADLGLKYVGQGKVELLKQLYFFLLRRREAGLTTALIVDEAQLLDHAVLEEIRLLTNLETDREKLLQILLVGQSELVRRLDTFELRQLKQRITLRWHLVPLTVTETKAYIARRLTIAGAQMPQSVISDAAAQEVFDHTGGVPRLINTLCENSLIAGYARNVRPVTSEMVIEAAGSLRLPNNKSTASAAGQRSVGAAPLSHEPGRVPLGVRS